jgi:hypothetical protein
MPLSRFRERLLSVRVRTVKMTSQSRKLPEYLWYSVVDDVAS